MVRGLPVSTRASPGLGGEATCGWAGCPPPRPPGGAAPGAPGAAPGAAAGTGAVGAAPGAAAAARAAPAAVAIRAARAPLVSPKALEITIFSLSFSICRRRLAHRQH